MPSFKSHPVFYTSLLVMGAVSAGAAWLNISQRGEITRLRDAIAQQESELSGYTARSPFPSRENLAAVESDRQKVESIRDEIRRSLSARSELAERLAAAEVPSSPTDAYFDIANFIERARETAASAGVVIGPDNRLGFAAYASTGPERDIIPLVFKQRQQADYLLGLLVAARPREIISVQRERLLTADQRRQVDEALAAGMSAPAFSGSGATDSADYFEINPMVTAAKQGFIETSAFRLTFDGTSASLRLLLNALARFELPVVVRSVEVESLTRSDASSGPVRREPPAGGPFGMFGGPGGGPDEARIEPVKPLVEQTDSRFVVTVEFVSLVDNSAEAAVAEAEASEVAN